jgi:diacylglycerol kinase family enzyme
LAKRVLARILVTRESEPSFEGFVMEPTQVRPTGGLPASDPPNPPIPRVAVVVNGRAKSVNEEVISTLDRIMAGGDLFVSKSLSDARDIARLIILRGYHTVLTGGGDGTFTVMVTEVVQEARRRQAPLPRFGLLKLGTGNALAWVVGASSRGLRDLQADIDRLMTDAGSRPIHLVEVEGQIAPFCGVGFDAALLADYAKTKALLGRTPIGAAANGFLSYAVAAALRTIPLAILGPMPHVRVINAGGEAYRMGARGSRVGTPFANGDTIYEGPARLAALSTIPYYGFGFRVFPFANERPDRMNLRITTISAGPFVRNAKSIWRGEYESSEHLFDFLVEAVDIEVDPATPLQIGGDFIGERSQVHAALTAEPIRLVDFYSPPSAT